jgi:hypothetical protein
MSSQTIQIRPEDLPNFITQKKAEKEALEKVLEIKREALRLLNQMSDEANSGAIVTALSKLAAVQILEYELQVSGFEEKLNQTNQILSQLDSPILTAQSAPAPPPGLRGGLTTKSEITFRGFKAPIV